MDSWTDLAGYALLVAVGVYLGLGFGYAVADLGVMWFRHRKRCTLTEAVEWTLLVTLGWPWVAADDWRHRG